MSVTPLNVIACIFSSLKCKKTFNYSIDLSGTNMAKSDQTLHQHHLFIGVTLNSTTYIPLWWLEVLIARTSQKIP